MEDHDRYNIDPELPLILRNWMREVLRYNPDNIAEFSRDYFAALYNTGTVTANVLHPLRGPASNIGIYGVPDKLSYATFQSSTEPQFEAMRAEREYAISGVPPEQHVEETNDNALPPGTVDGTQEGDVSETKMDTETQPQGDERAHSPEESSGKREDDNDAMSQENSIDNSKEDASETYTDVDPEQGTTTTESYAVDAGYDEKKLEAIQAKLVHAIKGVQHAKSLPINSMLTEYADVTGCSDVAIASKVLVLESVLLGLLPSLTSTKTKSSSSSSSSSSSNGDNATDVHDKEGADASTDDINSTNTTTTTSDITALTEKDVDSLLFYMLMNNITNDTSTTTDVTSAPVTNEHVLTSNYPNMSALLQAWHTNTPQRIQLQDGIKAVALASSELSVPEFVDLLTTTIQQLPGVVHTNLEYLGASVTVPKKYTVDGTGVPGAVEQTDEDGDDDGTADVLVTKDTVLTDFNDKLIHHLASNPEIIEENLRNALLSRELDAAVLKAENTLKRLKYMLETNEDLHKLQEATGSGSGATTTDSTAVVDPSEAYNLLTANVICDVLSSPVVADDDADTYVDGTVAGTNNTMIDTVDRVVSQRHTKLQQLYDTLSDSSTGANTQSSLNAQETVLLWNNVNPTTITNYIVEKFQQQRNKTVSKSEEETKDEDGSEEHHSTVEDVVEIPFTSKEPVDYNISSSSFDSQDFVRYVFNKTHNLTETQFNTSIEIVKQRYPSIHMSLSSKINTITSLFLDFDLEMQGTLTASLCKTIANAILAYHSQHEQQEQENSSSSSGYKTRSKRPVYVDYTNTDALYIDECSNEEPISITPFTLYILAKCGHVENNVFQDAVKFATDNLHME